MEIRWHGKRTKQRSYLSELLDLAYATGRRISAICQKLFMIDRGPRVPPALLPPPAESEPTEVSEARKQLVEEFSRMDGFAVAMSEGIGVLLEPWLSGSTRLDYVTVTQVMKWVLEGMKSQHQRERFEALRRRHGTGAEEGT